MITNSKNPIGNLNQETVQAIFTGNVREWSEVPGSKMTGPIDLVDRIASSGTQDAFQNIFLGPDLKISKSAEEEESNGLVQNKVKVDEHRDRSSSPFAFTAGVNRQSAIRASPAPCRTRSRGSTRACVTSGWQNLQGSTERPRAKAFRRMGDQLQKTRPPGKSSAPSG